MRLIYHPAAETELIEAARFYQGRVPGLGVEFLDAIETAVAAIQAAPERWKTIEDDIRRHLILRFPYAIYYRVHSDHVRILAFKHHSRHPDYWRGRDSH